MLRYTIDLTPSDATAASATITVDQSASGQLRVHEYAVRPGDGEHADSIPLLDVLLRAVRATRSGGPPVRPQTAPPVGPSPASSVATSAGSSSVSSAATSAGSRLAVTDGTRGEAAPVPPRPAERARSAAPRKATAAKPAKKVAKKAAKAKAKRGKVAADSAQRRVMPAEFPAALAQTSSTAALVDAFGVPAYTIRYWKQKVAKSQGSGA